MSVFLYKFFHNETNDRSEKGRVFVPQDQSLWPECWKKILFKKYSLFKSIKLPINTGVFMEDFLRKRKSSITVHQHEYSDIDALSYILRCGYGLIDSVTDDQGKRSVPSAGKRYPLELYLFSLKKNKWLKEGVYHYAVSGHGLEPVVLRSFSQDDFMKIVPEQGFLNNSSYMICITSVFDRSIDKYGSRGYRYILQESGHVAQNMIVAATEYDISLLPIGGIESKEVEKIIGLNSSSESLVYALFI